MLKFTMKDIFIQCQSGMQGHGKLLKSLQKIYDQKNLEEFWTEFQHLMMYSLIVFKREPAVERTIDFIAKFIPLVTTTTTKETASLDDSTVDEVSSNQLLQKMFDFLLQTHSAKDKAVRFRCCQMINKLLSNLGEDAQIDDDLYDRIYESMLERLRDKVPIVRMNSVMALSRLQDPRDENCPVIKAYLFLVNADPNPDVRRIVLSQIAPSTKTLAAILERTRDVKDGVRKTAFSVMGEKIHIKALSIANRVRLLQDGLTDRSELVKDACASKLLQAWLRTFGGNVLDLLGSLDVENSTETCELALETLLKMASVSEMVERFDLLDEKILIPLEKLNSESAMYWQTLCKYIHSLGSQGDEYLDKVLPNCVEFCSYVHRYVDTLRGLDDIDKQLEKEFVIQQLLTMTQYMELADQASLKAVETLLHEMLVMDHVGYSLVKYIVPRLCEIKKFSESLVLTFAETVSEIREPITTIEKGPTQEEKRQHDIKIAGIRVKLNQLKEDLDDSVRNQDFIKAAEVKASIAELETERNQLLKETETQVEEIRTEKTDVGTILKCQAIVAEMLEALPLKAMNPTLQMLVESLIIPGIQNEDARIRNYAVLALGLCCLLSRDLVLQYLPLFMQASQIDAETVRATALRVIFDMLHMHGMEAIQRGKPDEELESNTSGDAVDISRRSSTSERSNEDRSSAASKLVAILCAFLDGESSELRTVAAEGLAKLLLSGRVISSKILSHLILLWYNPTTEDDTHLRHCLGTFFPVFAFAGRSNQDVVEESFIPTLKTLMNAPLSSPLAEINTENVAELLVQLTNAKLLLENQKDPESVKDNPCHDSIAIKVCNEILSNHESFNLKLWVKILNQIELSEENDVSFKELAVLAEQLVEVVKDKTSLKSLQKFHTAVKGKIPETPSEEPAQEREMELGETADNADTLMEVIQEAKDGQGEKSVLNDTALQLDGSLFQESRTLRRANSKVSTAGTPPRSQVPYDLEASKSPIAALFPAKSFEFKTPERLKSRSASEKSVTVETTDQDKSSADQESVVKVTNMEEDQTPATEETAVISEGKEEKQNKPGKETKNTSENKKKDSRVENDKKETTTKPSKPNKAATKESQRETRSSPRKTLQVPETESQQETRSSPRKTLQVPEKESQTKGKGTETRKSPRATLGNDSKTNAKSPERAVKVSSKPAASPNKATKTPAKTVASPRTIRKTPAKSIASPRVIAESPQSSPRKTKDKVAQSQSPARPSPRRAAGAQGPEKNAGSKAAKDTKSAKQGTVKDKVVPDSPGTPRTRRTVTKADGKAPTDLSAKGDSHDSSKTPKSKDVVDSQSGDKSPRGTKRQSSTEHLAVKSPRKTEKTVDSPRSTQDRKKQAASPALRVRQAASPALRARSAKKVSDSSDDNKSPTKSRQVKSPESGQSIKRLVRSAMSDKAKSDYRERRSTLEAKRHADPQEDETPVKLTRLAKSSSDSESPSKTKSSVKKSSDSGKETSSPVRTTRGTKKSSDSDTAERAPLRSRKSPKSGDETEKQETRGTKIPKKSKAIQDVENKTPTKPTRSAKTGESVVSTRSSALSPRTGRSATREKSTVKTPEGDKRKTTIKSAAKKKWQDDDSDLDNSVFASPTPVRTSARKSKSSVAAEEPKKSTQKERTSHSATGRTTLGKGSRTLRSQDRN